MRSHGPPCTGEALDLELLPEPDARQVLAGGGPAIVDQDGLALVECRSDQTRPVGAELGGDQVDEFVVGLVGQARDLLGVAELLEHETGGTGENPVATGDLLGELAEGSGVDRRSPAATGGRHRHGDSATRGHRLHGGVDQLVDRSSIREAPSLRPPGRRRGRTNRRGYREQLRR